MRAVSDPRGARKSFKASDVGSLAETYSVQMTSTTANRGIECKFHVFTSDTPGATEPTKHSYKFASNEADLLRRLRLSCNEGCTPLPPASIENEHRSWIEPSTNPLEDNAVRDQSQTSYNASQLFVPSFTVRRQCYGPDGSNPKGQHCEAIVAIPFFMSRWIGTTALILVEAACIWWAFKRVDTDRRREVSIQLDITPKAQTVLPKEASEARKHTELLDQGVKERLSEDFVRVEAEETYERETH